MGDVSLLVWTIVWVRIATVERDATLTLTRPGKQIATAGDGVASRLREAGATVARTPLVGDNAAVPFDGAGDAANRITSAGTAQAAAAGHFAFWLGMAVGASPVLIVRAVYLPPR